MQRHRSDIVSVGLPVYNGEQYMEQAIDSILAQTHDDFELIISDNASSDRTQEICHAYMDKDARVHYHRNEKNIGLYRNFNRVFELSHGANFKWAATDDLCEPRLLERCLLVLNENPDTVLVCCNTKFVDQNGQSIDHEQPNWHIQDESRHDRMRFAINTEQNIILFDGLMRARAIRKTPCFPDYYGADRVLACNLAMLGKFYQIPETLFVKRLHIDNSATFAADANWFPKGGPLKTWRIYSGYLGLVVSSPLSTAEKLTLLRFTSKRLYWKKTHIKREVMHYLKSLAR